MKATLSRIGRVSGPECEGDGAYEGEARVIELTLHANPTATPGTRACAGGAVRHALHRIADCVIDDTDEARRRADRPLDMIGRPLPG